RLAFEYWGTNALKPGFDGLVRVQVRLYQNDGPSLNSSAGSPGTLIYDSGPLPVTAASKGALVLNEFQLSARVPLIVALSNSLTWSVQFSGLSSNDSAGLNLYGPPVAGQALPEYWQRGDSGWTLRTNALGSADFGGQLTAVNSGVSLTVLST